MKFSQLFDRFGQSRPGFGRVRDRLGSWIDKRCHRLISLRPGLSQEASDWLAWAAIYLESSTSGNLGDQSVPSLYLPLSTFNS